MKGELERSEIGLMVVSHGNLAIELLDAATRILGLPATDAVPVCIGWDMDAPSSKEHIKRALRKLQETRNRVLILTDLFGGTPTNLSMTFYQQGAVEILTGVNLPMLIKALTQAAAGPSLQEIVASLKEKGQSAIVSVSEVMDSKERPAR